MSSESGVAKIPKVDFSGLTLRDGTQSDGWKSVRAQVMQAVESHGFFEAVYDELSREVVDELFGPLLRELFDLPLETKMKNKSEKPFHGYGGHQPGSNLESFHVDDASQRESIEAFTRLMWPDGNARFCETVWKFTKALGEVDLMVRRMLAEGLDVGEQQSESLLGSWMKHAIRIIEYGAPHDQESMTGLGEHVDVTFMSIVYQHRRDGLQLQTPSGHWLHSPPHSLLVMISEGCIPWSNGRLRPVLHRVKMTSNEPRFSMSLGSLFNDGHLIEAPEELIDEQHPRLYKPYDHVGYLHFRFGEPGYPGKDALKVYCGVETNGNNKVIT